MMTLDLRREAFRVFMFPVSLSAFLSLLHPHGVCLLQQPFEETS